MKKNAHNIHTEAKTNPAPALLKQKFSLLETTESITQMINSIAKRGSVLEKDIHITSVSIINHTELHGDITLANRLIAAIPNLARKNALRDWFQSFGKFGYDKTSQTLTYDKTKTTQIDMAMTTPFWEFKPEAAYQAFDLGKAIAKVLKKAEERLQAGDERDNIDLNQLTALKLVFSTAIEANTTTEEAKAA